MLLHTYLKTMEIKLGHNVSINYYHANLKKNNIISSAYYNE